METVDLIGLASSAVLTATLILQTVTQLEGGRAAGATGWLFAGQMAAWVLLIAYRLVLHNAVFAVTNGLILVSAECIKPDEDVAGFIRLAKTRQWAREPRVRTLA